MELLGKVGQVIDWQAEYFFNTFVNTTGLACAVTLSVVTVLTWSLFSFSDNLDSGSSSEDETSSDSSDETTETIKEEKEEDNVCFRDNLLTEEKQ